MTQRTIKRIAIVGGGGVGWTLAAILARGLKQQPIAIQVIETPQVDTMEAAESSSPNIVPLLNILGVHESHMMSGSSAGFKLGTRYRHGDGGDFVVPFGEVGKPSPFGGFEQRLARAWLADAEQAPYDAFSLAATAARHSRFARPVPDPASILSTLAYGLNLDGEGYAGVVQGLASALGVSALAGDIRDVVLDSASGFISAVVLTDGRQLEADLWVDATGSRARLIQDALQVKFHSWQRWLPCDRLLTWKIPSDQPPAPMDTLAPEGAGWLHQVPLRGSLACTRLYHSEHVTDGESADPLRNGAEPQVITPGYRSAPWTGNCVAVGAAAGSPLPMAISHLQLAQAAAIRLLDLLPFGGPMAPNASLYNRITLGELERIRDFHIAHYHLAATPANAFWRRAKSEELPESLAHSLELFRYRGRVAFYEHDVIKPQIWTAFLLGMGIKPKHYDPVLNSEPMEQGLQLNKRILAAVAHTAASLPTHAEMLSRVTRQRR